MAKKSMCPDCGEQYDAKGKCSCNKSSAGKKAPPKKGKKPNPFQKKGY